MVRLTSPPAVYHPRQLLESDFHRLIRQHFDDFRSAQPHRYAREFGFWRPILDKAVVPQRDPGFAFEPDPKVLEHTRRQRVEQPDPPWEP